MDDTVRRVYEFGPFRFDPAERLLLRRGTEEPLTGKPLEVLALLVGSGGRVLEKAELMEKVWPDTFVDENRLADNVSTLRKALGDDSRSPSYIKTVPGRGYRFVADVREVLVEPFAVAERTRARIVVEEDSEAGAVALPALPARPRRHHNRLALAAGGLLAFALAFAGWYVLRDRAARAPLASSIAVLPFKPLVASEADPALELGITDALITKLANVRQIAVRPTNSVLKYTGEGVDLRAAGAELGVNVLLDGRVQKAGDRIRLSVQLVRTADGVPVWAETFDGRFTDIFTLQDEISRNVVSKLSVQLTGEDARGLARRYTEDPEAYQLYLKGLYHWRTFEDEGLLKSLNFYNAAIEKDPRYALAYSGLANAHTVIGIYGPDPTDESMKKARAAALKAIELDDTLSEGHAALGGNKMFYEWDWPGAGRELRRAIELAPPGSVNGRNLYGYYLQATGRFGEAVEELRKAAEAAPQWDVPAQDHIESYYVARRYDEAAARCLDYLRLEPDEPFILWVLGRSYMMKGMNGEAVATFRRGLNAVKGRDSGATPRVWLLSGLGYAHALAGRRGEALKAVADMRESRSRGKNLYIAMVFAGLGDKDQAFATLDEAYRERFPFLWEVRALPEFEPLRTDPRYGALLRRMNLPL